MGLIKAGMGAVGGVLADQWKEFFYCDSMPPDVLMMKGQKRTGGRSSNTGGEDNIISNGSVIAVNNGQCMMIVEQGKVVDLCAEPGEYTYDQSSEPSLFTGGLNKESVIAVFKQMGETFYLWRRYGERPARLFLQYKGNCREQVRYAQRDSVQGG